jgi:hypothetical protein
MSVEGTVSGGQRRVPYRVAAVVTNPATARGRLAIA